MSSQAGGGCGDTSSSARNEAEEDENEDVITQECDVCPDPACEDIVREIQDGLFCEGCNTWFHRKCVKIAKLKFQQHSLSNNDWYCSSCPNGNEDMGQDISWGLYQGMEEVKSKIESVYYDISTWSKNVFFLPWGKVSRLHK